MLCAKKETLRFEEVRGDGQQPINYITGDTLSKEDVLLDRNLQKDLAATVPINY